MRVSLSLYFLCFYVVGVRARLALSLCVFCAPMCVHGSLILYFLCFYEVRVRAWLFFLIFSVFLCSECACVALSLHFIW